MRSDFRPCAPDSRSVRRVGLDDIGRRLRNRFADRAGRQHKGERSTSEERCSGAHWRSPWELDFFRRTAEQDAGGIALEVVGQRSNVVGGDAQVLDDDAHVVSVVPNGPVQARRQLVDLAERSGPARRSPQTGAGVR